MDKFAYFALSIVWRRAAIDWIAFDGSVYERSPLGDFEEDVRKYLLRPAVMPPDIVVLVIVSSDKESRRLWITPTGDVFDDCINFRFLVRGVFFRVLMGYRMPPQYRDMCCTSARKCLFYGDGGHRVPEMMRIFEIG